MQKPKLGVEFSGLVLQFTVVVPTLQSLASRTRSDKCSQLEALAIGANRMRTSGSRHHGAFGSLFQELC
jgi:hypothetical protein